VKTLGRIVPIYDLFLTFNPEWHGASFVAFAEPWKESYLPELQ
jgi:hypothetical protein